VGVHVTLYRSRRPSCASALCAALRTSRRPSILRGPSPSFFFTDPAPPEIYTLSLHDALPISLQPLCQAIGGDDNNARLRLALSRSEEHTSELQSRFDLVCRLLLEKKN